MRQILCVQVNSKIPLYLACELVKPPVREGGSATIRTFIGQVAEVHPDRLDVHQWKEGAYVA